MCRMPLPFDDHCCYMGTAIKHPVPDPGVKPSFVIFDIWALWCWYPLLVFGYCYKGILCQSRLSLSFAILTSGHSDDQPWASECPDRDYFDPTISPAVSIYLYLRSGLIVRVPGCQKLQITA